MTPLLSVKDVARLLSISVYSVRAYVKAGKLRPVRIGTRVLVEEREIQRFIDESKNLSASIHNSL